MSPKSAVATTTCAEAISKHTGMTMDELRKQVAIITEEERLKEPQYYQWICAVTGLKKAQDMQTLFFLFLYFSTAYLSWNWESYVGSHSLFAYVPFLIVYAVNTYCSFVGATITHNTIHSTMFRNSFVNRCLQVVLTLTYGHPVSTYVPGHNLSHHKYTQSKKDIMNTYMVDSKSHMINFFFFQQTVVMTSVISDIRYILLQKEMGRYYYVSQAMREFGIMLIVMAVLFYLSPLKFFLFFYVPHLFGQWGIVTMNLLQHDGCDEFVPGEKEINFNTARNFLDPMLNFWVMNNGYHTIHHLVPTSHWSINKTLHERLIVGRIDPRLDWESKGAYVWHAYFMNGNPWNKNPLRCDYKGLVVDMSRGVLDPKKLAAPTYKYEEWLPFPKDFDRAVLPTSKSTLISAVLVLAFKVMISPIYTFNPKLKLI